MKNQRFLPKRWLALSVGIGFFTGMQEAVAREVLPAMTVYPPRTPLEQLISSPQILEEDELSVAHERSIADVVLGFPGISVTRISGYGQQSGFFIRGAGGQGVVTLDDIPLFASVPGLLNLDTLPVEALQKAEIERGPGAAHHPFQSLGGSIRLYTRDREETGATVTLEGGSFGIVRETLQGALAGALGRATLTLSRGDAFDGNKLATGSDNPEREPFRFSQGIFRFSSDLSSRLNWQGSVLYRKSWIGSDTLGFDAKRRVAFKDDRFGFGAGETWLAQTSLNAKLAANWHSRLQLGYTELASTVATSTVKNDLFNRMYLATLRNQHVLIEDATEGVLWQLSWGGQGRHEQGLANPGSFDEQRTMTAGFLETEARYGKLSGQMGVRVEHFDRFGTHALFNSAAAWRITPSLTLRASGGTGYRIPSYTELLNLFFGNRLLKPEHSASGDLGLEWRVLDNLRITVNGYYNRYDNLISQAYHPQRGPVTVNIADASVAGMELDIQYAWTQFLETGVSYSYSDSRDLLSDLHLPLRPPHTARIWGKQKLTGLPVTLWAEAIVRSATWNDTANTIPINQSLQVNASIRYAVSSQFEVYVRGENLTDNRTPQFYSIDVPGAAVYGGFRLDF